MSNRSYAQVVDETVSETVSVTTNYMDGTSVTRVLDENERITEDGKIVKIKETETDKGIAKGFTHFIWGLESGISADLSGMDMSTFNFDVIAGYRGPWVQTAGLGAGIHKSLGTKDSFIPIYVLFRSSFRPKPSLFFFHLRIGYSFNTISNSPTFGDTNAGIGCGINLSQSRKYQSYILLAYTFRHFNNRHAEMSNINRSNVSLAQIAFGLTF